MNNEKEKILDMVEKGTISAEDAARLLECVGETEEKQKEREEERAHVSAQRMKGKRLRVLVNGVSEEGQKINVNVGVPLVLARYADNILATCVPAEVTEELGRQGIDLKGIRIGEIVDVFEEIEEDIVNVDIGEEGNGIKVRVYVE